ncbi:hypothetical protein E1301_Tti018825 [Triplophysa tibetana]|uniref:Uncharacterized protein n=1 Tax=Triplophysa tibetana TaxID=1572043 RepID=A0A5A9P4P9_9TELE|nr:hypothetical protein E1301_Tti018825 [Triplophysa tibetana]
MDPVIYQQIVSYKCHGKYPDGLCKNEKKKFRKKLIFLKLKINHSMEETISVEKVTESAIKLSETLLEAGENIKKSQKKIQKKCQSLISKFKVGDKVWRQNIRTKQRKGGKLDANFLGPFTITSLEGKSADLENGMGVKIPKINIDRLKPYCEESPRVPHKIQKPSTISQIKGRPISSQQTPAPQIPGCGHHSSPLSLKPQTPDLGCLSLPLSPAPQTPDHGRLSSSVKSAPKSPDLSSLSSPISSTPQTPDLGCLSLPLSSAPQTPDHGCLSSSVKSAPMSSDQWLSVLICQISAKRQCLLIMAFCHHLSNQRQTLLIVAVCPHLSNQRQSLLIVAVCPYLSNQRQSLLIVAVCPHLSNQRQSLLIVAVCPHLSNQRQCLLIMAVCHHLSNQRQTLLIVAVCPHLSNQRQSLLIVAVCPYLSNQRQSLLIVAVCPHLSNQRQSLLIVAICPHLSNQCQSVREAWKGKNVNVLLAKIGPFKLFYADIHRTAPTMELESEVMNAFVYILVRKFNESSQDRAASIDSYEMSNIWIHKRAKVKFAECVLEEKPIEFSASQDGVEDLRMNIATCLLENTGLTLVPKELRTANRE